MLVLDGGKGLMLGYWLGCRRGKFQKQSPLDGGSQATILYVSDPNTGFPGGSDSKDSACYAGAAAATQLLQGCLTLCDLTACSPPGSSVHGDWDSIPGLGRFPGDENSYLLPYSCLENSTSFKKANIKNWVRDFPDGPVVKNLPGTGTWVQSLVRELRSQTLQSN